MHFGGSHFDQQRGTPPKTRAFLSFPFHPRLQGPQHILSRMPQLQPRNSSGTSPPLPPPPFPGAPPQKKMGEKMRGGGHPQSFQLPQPHPAPSAPPDCSEAWAQVRFQLHGLQALAARRHAPQKIRGARLAFSLGLGVPPFWVASGNPKRKEPPCFRAFWRPWVECPLFWWL